MSCERTLLCLIDSSAAYRDLVHGRALDELLKQGNWRVVLAAVDYFEVLPEDIPSDSRVSYRKFSPKLGGPFRKLAYVLDKIIHKIGRDLIIIQHPGTTIAEIRRNRCMEFRKNYTLHVGYARLLYFFGLRWHHLSRLAEKWGSYPTLAKLLDEVKPGLVTYSNMRVGQMDCLREARRRGIPILLDGISWDNPTSKGAMLLIPDHVFVWSERMRQEMLTIHGMGPDQVHITGGLCWDGHARPQVATTRDEFCAQLGIPPGHKIILYALARPKTVLCQLDFISVLCRIIEENRLGIPCHLVARVNPVDMHEFEKGALDHPCLTLQSPSGTLDPKSGKWKADKSNLSTLSTTLTHSDVVVTVQSSMIIDASFYGKPVVNLGYDAGKQRPFYEAVERVFRFTHARSVLELDPTYIVKSEEDLITAIKRGLEFPNEKGPQQRRFLEEVCGPLDGLSYQRWAQAVDRLVPA
jgi:hypothetical protein